MSPLISIVMPCFNAARWLPEAISSLRSQTYRNFELIVIDDGSTDATPEILTSLLRNDPRVKVLRTPKNLGIVAALNRGLNEAQGEVVARMDADDIAKPERFRQQLYLLEAGVDLCGSWFTEFGLGVSRTVRWPHREAAVRAAMLFQNALCHPTVMARRAVFENLRYREDYNLAEDYDLFGRACTDFHVANVPEALVRYRRHPQQATLAKRTAMEAVTQRIRIELLRRQGFDPTPNEQRLHNMIRAPASIQCLNDLRGIEMWLLKLYDLHDTVDARQVIASQWIRACIRAAPLGRSMWNAYRSSRLRTAAGAGTAASLDLLLLSITRLRYCSQPFEWLRRFGLSG